jgi:hypothetical protein
VEATSGDPGPATFIARRMQNFKGPVTQAEDLTGKVQELKKDGDAYAGDLTEEAAKSQLMFGGRAGGGNGPEISGAKGSVKFWVKDGLLSKCEIKVKGSVNHGKKSSLSWRLCGLIVNPHRCLRLAMGQWRSAR